MRDKGAGEPAPCRTPHHLGGCSKLRVQPGYPVQACTLGQVSRPEQKASVTAALFPHTEPAADSMASSETSKIRTDCSFCAAPLSSFIGFSCLTPADWTGQTQVYSGSAFGSIRSTIPKMEAAERGGRKPCTITSRPACSGPVSADFLDHIECKNRLAGWQKLPQRRS